MRPEQRDAILDLAMRKISEQEFCRSYEIELGKVSDEVIFQLQDALNEVDSDLVECSVLLAEHFNLYADASFTDRIAPIYRELLVQNWHQKHEDFVRLLQKLRDGRNIAAFEQAIRLKPSLEYLDYDDRGAFYRKCLWALQEVGTPDAIAVIRKFSDSEVRELREAALDRLSGVGESAT